ncbi:DUF3515 domain-containing protein [Nocardia sp. NPDC049190]|uniref:DUF3515 domain-containing protein n=1 Tax=Nocardia sp. NPDC049190 TaxID=3155650 RepID=UPI0033D6388B
MTADSSDRDSAKDERPADSASSAGASGSERNDGPAARNVGVDDADATTGPAEAGASDADGPSSTADTTDTGTAATVPDTGLAPEGTEATNPDATRAEPDATSKPSAGDDISPEHQYSPALIATAVALPVVLVVAVLVAAVLAHRAPVEREHLVLGPVPAPAADGPACTALLPALPAQLGEFTKSTLVEPAPPATRAWQRAAGGDAIVLRCGLDRPLEFNRASPLQIVNGVQWFEARDRAATASTWFAVDRATYVALTVPDGSGPTPLQEVSDTITTTLPAQSIDPGPLPN